MRIVPTVHTVEARTMQIASVQEKFPEAILIGSVARAALVGSNAPVSNGTFGHKVRDLDFTTTDGEILGLTGAEQRPFPADSILQKLITIDETGSSATVAFDSNTPQVSVKMDAEIFAPYPVVIDGTRVNTFHPDTMRRIHLIMGSNRAKDRKSKTRFEAALTDVTYSKMSDKVFEPLTQLGLMVENDPVLRRQRLNDRLQESYSVLVPDAVRNSFKPAMSLLKHVAHIRSRYE